jgi:hypothetical protein
MTDVFRIVTVVLGSAGVAGASTVALGSDYFQTEPTTFFNFAGIGTIDFTGLPNTIYGLTDTIIQRLQDTTINAGSAPTGSLTNAEIASLPNATNIMIADLSLQSTAPVSYLGNLFNVTVTLDPGELLDDTGRIAIYGTTAGGTFDSELNVFFDVHFTPVTTGTAFDIDSLNTVLTQTGGLWNPTPPPNTVIVNGVIGTQAANLHSGLSANEVDFFPGYSGGGAGGISAVSECNSTDGCHVVQEASSTPEPGTIFLFLPGAAALLLMRRKLSWMARKPGSVLRCCKGGQSDRTLS